MTLKEKSISGFFWSFTDSLGSQITQFVIGIVLARILTPEDYGLVGIITVFIVISQSFIDSGFTQALIRKNDVSQIDYSTVFYFNIAIGIITYTILFFGSTSISVFFEQPLLSDLVKVLGLTIIISSFSIVQRAKLTKEINFKLQTKISMSSNIVSGSVGISLALYGYGVWSLVWKTLLNNGLNSLFLWIFNKWKPSPEFSKSSFKEMFNFGYKLLLSGLLYQIYNNIYYFIIGKFFSATELGLYTRADQFKNLFSQNLNSTIQRVSYPVLSSIQDNEIRLKNGYKNVLKLTVFISSILMLGLAGLSESLIIVLIGAKWLGAVEYLQLLCFVGMFFPLHALNLNILNVKGRSDLFLWLEIIKKILAIPTIIIGIYLGIRIMILAMIVNSIIAYYLNSRYSGRLIDYSTYEQIRDVSLSFLIAFVVGGILYFFNWFTDLSPIITLISQLIIGFILVITMGEFLKIYEYNEIKNIFYEKINRIKNAK